MILSKIRNHIQEDLNLQHLKLWCIIKWTYQLNLNMKPLFLSKAYSCFQLLIHGNYHLPIFHLTGMILPKQQSFQTPKASSEYETLKNLLSPRKAFSFLDFSYMVTTTFQFFIWQVWYYPKSQIFRHPKPVQQHSFKNTQQYTACYV